MQDKEQVLAEIDARIAERSILNHPFYQAWAAGALSREQLATYARAYYPHVAAFPGYLETAIAGTADPAIRTELEANLAEELGVPAPHPELWLDFAEACGADRAEVVAAAPTPGTRDAVARFERLCATGTAQALAALYAYESQQPEVARTKADGLCQLYALESPAALGYFEVHTEADVRHRQGERDSLAACLAQGTRPEELFAATDEALDAYWSLLDGICHEAGLTTVC